MAGTTAYWVLEGKKRKLSPLKGRQGRLAAPALLEFIAILAEAVKVSLDDHEARDALVRIITGEGTDADFAKIANLDMLLSALSNVPLFVGNKWDLWEKTLFPVILNVPQEELEEKGTPGEIYMGLAKAIVYHIQHSLLPKEVQKALKNFTEGAQEEREEETD